MTPNKCKWNYNCSREAVGVKVGPLGPTPTCAECYAEWINSKAKEASVNARAIQVGTGLINLGQGLQSIGCAITLIVGVIVFLVLLASSC